MWRDITGKPTLPVSGYPLPVRHLRLITGLVMLTYVSMHLLNHSLGLFSTALAEEGLRVSISLWQSTPGTVALYGAFAIHFSMALRTIYRRRHWKLPFIEWVRLWSGFSLPLLLIGHAVSTRIAASPAGSADKAREIAGERPPPPPLPRPSSIA